ncbi:hypothetical protein CcaCcLH18_08654 [Colletotrichum camelliae]|nr:hypothetical protein CcaCcLH18_08654 [Colletotrichum camelliae]
MWIGRWPASDARMAYPDDPKEVPPILRMDALRRLYWPVYEDISRIQVFDDPEEDENDSPKRPFLGHPFSKEPVTNYGLTELLIRIGIQEDKECHTLDNEEYEDPKLLVKREDGGAITMEDFVTQIHPFLLEHKEETLELWELFLERVHEDDIILFDSCWTGYPQDLDDRDEDLPFFELNPGVTPDCSNINPSSEYCVKGCMSQLLSILHDNIPIFEESLGLFVADTNKIYSTLYRLTGSVVPITVTHPARELTFNAATLRPGSVERPSKYIFLWCQIFDRISFKHLAKKYTATNENLLLDRIVRQSATIRVMQYLNFGEADVNEIKHLKPPFCHQVLRATAEAHPTTAALDASQLSETVAPQEQPPKQLPAPRLVQQISPLMDLAEGPMSIVALDRVSETAVARRDIVGLPPATAAPAVSRLSGLAPWQPTYHQTEHAAARKVTNVPALPLEIAVVLPLELALRRPTSRQTGLAAVQTVTSAPDPALGTVAVRRDTVVQRRITAELAVRPPLEHVLAFPLTAPVAVQTASGAEARLSETVAAQLGIAGVRPTTAVRAVKRLSGPVRASRPMALAAGARDSSAAAQLLVTAVLLRVTVAVPATTAVQAVKLRLGLALVCRRMEATHALEDLSMANVALHPASAARHLAIVALVVKVGLEHAVERKEMFVE